MFHHVQHIFCDIKSESSFCNVMGSMTLEGLKNLNRISDWFKHIIPRFS